jgi:YidC/Oxa1 family membrane protein insertase
MGQQFIVIRNMPTPGSQAFKDRQARLEKKGKLPKSEEANGEDAENVQISKQRVQPPSKARAKKGKNTNGK